MLQKLAKQWLTGVGMGHGDAVAHSIGTWLGNPEGRPFKSLYGLSVECELAAGEEDAAVGTGPPKSCFRGTILQLI